MRTCDRVDRRRAEQDLAQLDLRAQDLEDVAGALLAPSSESPQGGTADENCARPGVTNVMSAPMLANGGGRRGNQDFAGRVRSDRRRAMMPWKSTAWVCTLM